jgi:hypothetical protein
MEDVSSPEIIILDDEEEEEEDSHSVGNDFEQEQLRPGTSADDAISISSGEHDDDGSNDGFVSGYIRRPEQASFASKFEQLSGQPSPMKHPTGSTALPWRAAPGGGGDRLPPPCPASLPAATTVENARIQSNSTSIDISTSLAPLRFGQNRERSSQLGLATEPNGEVACKQSELACNQKAESSTGASDCKTVSAQGLFPPHTTKHLSTVPEESQRTQTKADRQQPQSESDDDKYKSSESSDESYSSLNTQLSSKPTDNITRPADARQDTSMVMDKISTRATAASKSIGSAKKIPTRAAARANR